MASSDTAATSASATRRLLAAAESIAAGQCPECPVCLEQPAAFEARILRCCAAIICRACVPLCSGSCPFCRRPFEALGESCSHDDVGRVVSALQSGESPHTYSTLEYRATLDFSTCSDYEARGDYTTTAGDYLTTADYTHTNQDYTVPATDASSNDYANASSVDYSVLANDYSAPTLNYTATDYSGVARTDYSDIATRYLSADGA